MATREQLEMLAGRALLNPEFLYGLVRDPQAVANSVGIFLDEEQILQLKQFQTQEGELREFAVRLGNLRGEMGRFDPSVVWAAGGPKDLPRPPS